MTIIAITVVGGIAALLCLERAATAKNADASQSWLLGLFGCVMFTLGSIATVAL